MSASMRRGRSAPSGMRHMYPSGKQPASQTNSSQQKRRSITVDDLLPSGANKTAYLAHPFSAPSAIPFVMYFCSER